MSSKSFGKRVDDLRRARRFVTDGVWDIELSSLSIIRRIGVKLLRVVHLVATGFKEDQCPLHASALTFNTLMSIVPILAVSLAVARGFGAGDSVESKVRTFLRTHIAQIVVSGDATNAVPAAAVEQTEPPSPVPSGTGSGTMTPDKMEFVDQIDQAVAQIFSSIGNISFAKLGGIGLALLLWSVVQVLGSVESSFNQIWGVTAGRPLHRKFFDYIGVLIVVPLLAIAASSLPVLSLIVEYAGRLDRNLAERLGTFLASSTIQYLVAVILAASAFTFLIMFMPNTRVKFKAGMTGGLIASVLFLLWLWLCMAIQIGVIKYSKIYGSFAIVPIIMFWVYVSWEIVLLGSQIAFAVQNCDTYRMELRAQTASVRTRFGLALAVSVEAARSMAAGTAFDASAFAAANTVPVRLLNDVIKTLVDSGFLIEAAGNPGHYSLLRAPDRISGKEIFDAILRYGEKPGEFKVEALGQCVADVLKLADKGLGSSLSDISLRSVCPTT